MILSSFFPAACQPDTSGPVFIEEPPNQVDFSNTTGTEIVCQARGTPMPRITWLKPDGTVVKDVPGLRQVGTVSVQGRREMQTAIKVRRIETFETIFFVCYKTTHQ